jgi:NCS1 family nucleobase:cation symporter-1
LNPLTYESHGPFRFLTASLPAVVVAASVFVALTILFIVPAKRGAYELGSPLN